MKAALPFSMQRSKVPQMRSVLDIVVFAERPSHCPFAAKKTTATSGTFGKQCRASVGLDVES